ncbi:hypothetical protein Pmar_PMAR008986 [Perkinsus marinus ATCC 50983]|uniref:Sperm microtubule inner protein 1 C-terminal domain-containing protein n=1 Tax=Perkinsus marinus (strain ATCC 50983 / TXsc) TaxID=423536 RepID=C5LM73_PERM5|nr:hypothetical protein Pmar_PMAR008986 [Perkinsus marinus ATCC 50983]EER02204.1 hypothetical protein Pmar_PMAR008986 [Perkinsus marinus ATCC 50983]|eukprot:XP_002769486.1 hypothetical protein Pmar_PMAR008986 [Perkinsus marinus ATCC 50983]
MSAGTTTNEMKAWREIFEKERGQQRKWIQNAFEEYKKSGKRLKPRYKFDGRGSTIWIGLNADPCKAKYLAKFDLGTSDKTDPTEPFPAPKSSAVRFLEQRFALSPPPYCEFSTKKIPRGELLARETSDAVGEELLVYGVSSEEEGKRAYLDFRRRTTGPQQRCTGAPVTTAMEVGWTVPAQGEAQTRKRSLSAGASEGNARGLMKATFYRSKIAGHGVHRREDAGALAYF